jgi:hypothetical protein
MLGLLLHRSAWTEVGAEVVETAEIRRVSHIIRYRNETRQKRQKSAIVTRITLIEIGYVLRDTHL